MTSGLRGSPAETHSRRFGTVEAREVLLHEQAELRGRRAEDVRRDLGEEPQLAAGVEAAVEEHDLGAVAPRPEDHPVGRLGPPGVARGPQPLAIPHAVPQLRGVCGGRRCRRGCGARPSAGPWFPTCSTREPDPRRRSRIPPKRRRAGRRWPRADPASLPRAERPPRRAPGSARRSGSSARTASVAARASPLAMMATRTAVLGAIADVLGAQQRRARDQQGPGLEGAHADDLPLRDPRQHQDHRVAGADPERAKQVRRRGSRRG